MTELSEAALPLLDPAVARPAYDRSRVRVGMVHLGVGGFHRSHQAMFVDRLLTEGHTEWGICGVGLLPADMLMRDALDAQDGLYTLVLKHPDGSWEPRVIGSIIEYLYAPDDPEAVLDRMTAPGTTVVSLTVTEGGYGVDPLTARFDPGAVGLSEPEVPLASAFRLVIEALARRREQGVPAFAVVSCDNIPRNGDVARLAFRGAAAVLRDAPFADWVTQHVEFPNSMVDRITPTTTDDDRAEVERRFAIHDRWPVVAEPFVQWVLEDAFDQPRPPLEQVGVQVVANVDPYEAMKLRLLNAGHQTLGYLGYLMGHRYSDEAVRDPLLRALLVRYLWQEAMPTVPPVAGIDLDDYATALLERFGNAAVRDSLLRICTQGSDRIRTFLLPVIRDRRAVDADISCGALVVAGWARFAEGTDEQGADIPVVDRQLDRLRPALQRQREDPGVLLRDRDRSLFGGLADDDVFVQAVHDDLVALHRDGARRTVARLLGLDPQPT